MRHPKDFDVNETISKEIVLAQGVYSTDFNILSNGDNTFTVFWQELTNTKSSLGYYDWWVAQVIDGDGNLIGEQKWYEDPYFFYLEFFNVQALPDSDAIAKLTLADQITITFDSKGGSKVEAVTATGISVKIKKPKDPTREGYKFLGWYEEYVVEPVDFSRHAFTENTTLSAKWKSLSNTVTKYKVTFEPNNGVSPKTIRVKKGSKLTKPDTPAPLTDHKFAGWYKDKKCTKKWDFRKDKVNGNMTLYAKWTKIKK